MLNRFHGVVCSAIHRSTIKLPVVSICETTFHCSWVFPPVSNKDITWAESGNTHGEIDLWSDHGETLIQITINRHFQLDGRKVTAEALERRMATLLAARMHRILWGTWMQGRLDHPYQIDCDGNLMPSIDKTMSADLQHWIERGRWRWGALSAVGEDEYVRGFMVSYVRRKRDGYHLQPVREVEGGLRRQYRNTLAQYEGYKPDAETLCFEVAS